MRKYSPYRKFLSLIIAGLLLSQQFAVSAPEAGALNVQPFTSPLSGVQEEINAVRTFLVERLFQLRQDGIDPKTTALTVNHFPAQTLFDTSADDANKSKRILVEKVTRNNEDHYSLACKINGRLFIARLSFTGDDPEISVEELDTDDVRFFPAVNAFYEGNEDLREQTQEALGSADSLIHGLFSPDNRDLEYFSRQFILMLKQAFNKGAFNDIPNIAEFFRDTPSNRIEDRPIRIWASNGNRVYIEKMLQNIGTAYPSEKKDFAKICHAISLIFYEARKTGGARAKYILYEHAEFFAKMAHRLDEHDFYYHKNWALMLSKCKRPMDARNQWKKLIHSHLSPEKVEKIIADVAFNDYEEARRMLQGLESAPHASDINTLDLKKFTDDVSHVANLLTNIDTMVNASFSDISRAISFKGGSHIFMARLLKVKYEHGMISPETYVYESIREAYLGLRYLKEANNNAKSKIPDTMRQSRHEENELVHTINMFTGSLQEILPVLQSSWQAVIDNNLSIASHGKITEIKTNISRITALTAPLEWNERNPADYARRKKAFDDTSRAVQNFIRKPKRFRLWTRLHEKAHVMVREKLRDTERDVSAALQDIARDLTIAISDMLLDRANTIFTDMDSLMIFADNLANDVVDRDLAQLRITQDDICVLAARNTLENENRTLIRIKEAADELTGRTSDMTEFNARLERLSSLLGFAIMEEPKAETPVEQSVPHYRRVPLSMRTANGLESLKDAGKVFDLEAKLADSDWRVRTMAAGLISEIPPGRAKHKQRIIASLERALGTENSCEAAHAITDCLIKLGETKYALEAGIYKAIAEEDVSHLGPSKRANPRQIQLAIRVIENDTDRDSRRKAIRLLGEIGTSRTQDSTNALEAALRGNEHSSIKRAAAEALGKIKYVRSKDIITSSSDESRDDSFPARLKRLKRSFETLRPWIRYEDSIPTSYASLVSNMEELELLILEYTEAVQNLSSGSTNWKTERSSLSALFYSIDESLPRVEQTVEKLQRFIVSLISTQVSEVENKLVSFQSKYSTLGLAEWIDNMVSTLKQHILQLTDLLDEGNEPIYLSHDDYSSLTEKINVALEDISRSGECLDTYAAALNAIDASQKEAALIGPLVGSPSLLQNYMDDLDNFKTEHLLSAAVRGNPFDTLTDGEKAFCRDLPARTEFLKSIRILVQETVDGIDALLSSEDGRKLPAETAEEMTWKTHKAIVETISPNGSLLNILRWECDPHISPLNEQSQQQLLANLRQKSDVARSIIETRILANNLQYLINIADTLVPGIYLGSVDNTYQWHLEEIDAAFDELADLEAFDNEFDLVLNSLGTRIREQQISINNTRTEVRSTLYKKWFERLHAEINILSKFFQAWSSEWLGDFGQIRGNAEAIASALDRISKVLTDPDIENLDECISGIGTDFTQAERGLEDMGRLLEEMFFNEHSRNLRSFMHPNGFLDTALSAISRGSVSARGGHSGRHEYALVPVLNDTGMLQDIELHIFPSVPSRTEIITLKGSLETTHPVHSFTELQKMSTMIIEAETLGDIDDFIQNRQEFFRLILELDERKTAYNMIVAPKTQEHMDKDLALYPEYVRILLINALRHYKQLLAVSERTLPAPGTTVDIGEFFLKRVREGALANRENGYRERDEASYALSEKVSYLEGRAEPSDSDMQHMARAESILKAHKDWKTRHCTRESWNFVNAFYPRFITLLNEISGRDYGALLPESEEPRTMLTLPEKRDDKLINIFALYPPDPSYSGIYFQTGKFKNFGVLKHEKGLKAQKLSWVLQDACEAFLDYLADKKYFKDNADYPENDTGYSRVKKLLKSISDNNQVHIAVAKGLPTNSLTIGNTIMFDKDFIDFLLKQAEKDESALLILAERFFHELGHVSMRHEGLDRVEEEVRQIEADVLFHRDLFLKNPFLAMMMERFTDTVVDKKKKLKFSHVFNSSKLFKKIRRWAFELEFGPENIDDIRKDIRIFVMDNMKNIVIIPNKARLFPATPPSVPSFPALEKFKEHDMAMLDTPGKRDRSFLSKKRHIVISSSLIPDCQRKLIKQINDRSKEAFDSGWTHDLIEIKPFSYIQNLRSDETHDIVVLIEQAESELYRGNEARLIFSREGDHPVMINGLVAAGRAVLYKEMDKLRDIIMALSGRDDLKLPGSDELARYLEEDKEMFAKLLAIVLPPMGIASKEIDELNRNIIHLMQFA